jgi:8-oxo-dGTP diphosphatase
MKEPIRKLDRHGEAALQKPPKLVVAALILRHALNGHAQNGASVDSHREVLICQRKPDQPMSLKWEFPGGKVEDGETSEQALARELDEELGIHARIGRQIARVRHKYRNGGTIDLQFFVVDEFQGALENRIFNDMRWSSLPQLIEYDFLAADLGLIRDLSEGKLL